MESSRKWSTVIADEELFRQLEKFNVEFSYIPYHNNHQGLLSSNTCLQKDAFNRHYIKQYT